MSRIGGSISRLVSQLVSSVVGDSQRQESPPSPPPPAPPTAQDVFEQIASNPLVNLVGGAIAQAVGPVVQGVVDAARNAQQEIRGGPAPLTDPTGVADIQYDHSDPAGEDNGPITRTQQFLEAAGYLDMGGADYGYFGDKTSDAIQAFQEAEGIEPADGVMSEDTLAAMQNPHPLPDASVSHLAEAYRPELGRPMTPLELQEDGSQVQRFENGTLTITPEGDTRVQDLSGKDIVPPIAASTVTSVEEANQLHVSQRGENDFNDGSEDYGYNDCGPTSIVIAASATGVMENPDAANAGEAIDGVRDSILGPSNESVTMDSAQIVTGVEATGAVATTLPQDVASIDEALARGHPVIIGGNPFGSDPEHQAWGPTEVANGNYLEPDNFGGHWATVVGMTDEGNYIVCDPLCPDSAIEVTPAQMAEYVDGGFGIIEVAPPPPPVS